MAVWILSTVFKLRFWPKILKLKVLCLVMFTGNSLWADTGINTQQAHEILRTQHHHLLGEGGDIVSLYFFGSEQLQAKNTTLIGLERVGDDYLPVRWLLVFENQTLLGWYYPVAEFPKTFSQGKIHFPKGMKADILEIYPYPPEQFLMLGKPVQFHSAQAPTNSDIKDSQP